MLVHSFFARSHTPRSPWLLRAGVVGLLGCAAPALAGSTQQAAEGWMLDSWTVEDGLPLEQVNDLAIDADGYVWLATWDGLVRFDGQRFDTLRSEDPLGPTSTRLRFVVAHPTDGSLWVVDGPRRLQRRAGATVTDFEEPELRALQEPVAGEETIWMVLEAGLARLDGEPSLVPTPEGGAAFAVVDPRGDLQLRAADERLWVQPRGSDGWQLVADAVPAPGYANRLAPSGEPIWVDFDDRAWRVDREAGELVEVPEPRRRSARAPARELPWHAVEGEVFLHGELVATLGATAHHLVEHEGEVWIATTGAGLARLRPAAARTHLHPDGGPSNVERLWWDEDAGVLWAVAATERWWPLVVDGEAPQVPPDPVRFRPAWRRGAGWWLGGYGAAHHAESGELEVVRGAETRLDELLAAVKLSDGAWLLGDAHGLWRSEGRAEAVPVATGHGAVRDLRVSEGHLWVGTVEHGLCLAPLERLDDEGWRCLGAGSSLGRATVHATLSDGRRTWLSTNRGIGVFDTDAVLAFVQGGPEPVALWLGRADGLRTAEANGFLGGGGVRTPDGRLWFATQEGVVEIDPARVEAPAPPAARIAEAWTDDVVTPLPVSLELATDHAPLSLRLDAPALRWSEQLAFRYRLSEEGGWSGASEARTLELPSLPPGESLLEVQARLGGAWGPSARLAIVRVPALQERPIFPVLVALATALFAGLVFGWRSRMVRRLNLELERRVDEQTLELAEKNEALARQNVELAELDALKRRLIANVSHELRTPLTLIMGPLGTLLERLRDDAEARGALQLAIDSARQLDQLIGQLFALARAQAGGLQLQVRHVDATRLAHNVVHRFEGLAAEGGVQLALDAPVEPAGVWLEWDLIDKVLGNLVANALRHAPRGSTVELRLTLEDDHLRIEVEDEGPGVASDHREAIFERFVQIDEGGASGGGAGIGLALARELVELHGGRIGVQAGRVGARFWLLLPLGTAHLALEDVDLTEEPEQAGTRAPSPVGEVEVTGTRVLVVEDHDQLRSYLCGILGEHFVTTAAEHGPAALERLGEQSFDVLVSDVMMPGMDGHELLRRVRALPGGDTLPALFVSARGEVHDRVEGLELADDYLAKPFQAPELVARVRALLRRSRQHAQAARPEPIDDASRLGAELEAVARPRLGERGFHVAALARATGRSPRTLQLHMQDAGLPTPSAWLRTLRLEVAREALASGEHATVGEVAAAVGMDRAYFSRAYRAYTGRTPGDDLA